MRRQVSRLNATNKSGLVATVGLRSMRSYPSREVGGGAHKSWCVTARACYNGGDKAFGKRVEPGITVKTERYQGCWSEGGRMEKQPQKTSLPILSSSLPFVLSASHFQPFQNYGGFIEVEKSRGPPAIPGQGRRSLGSGFLLFSSSAWQQPTPEVSGRNEKWVARTELVWRTWSVCCWRGLKSRSTRFGEGMPFVGLSELPDLSSYGRGAVAFHGGHTVFQEYSPTQEFEVWFCLWVRSNESCEKIGTLTTILLKTPIPRLDITSSKKKKK